MPEISDLAKQSQFDEKNVVKRMIKIQEAAVFRREKKEREVMEKREKNYTFHPAIDEKSKLIAPKHQNMDIFEKLTEDSKVNQIIKSKTEEIVHPECTFSPKIN